jgi:Flp pilus assembly CpaF family ATPase
MSKRDGRLEPVDAAFTDESHLRRTIDKIVSRVGRRVDDASPMVDARLPDGSRVNAVVPPIALDGSLLTIRKFAADPFTVDDLISFGTLTGPVAELLQACVRGRLNILIGGGTGSGKTTTLNVLSSFLPDGRTHRHDRGRRRAATAAGPRTAPRVASRERREAWRDRDPRTGAQLPADAPRPHHHR